MRSYGRNAMSRVVIVSGFLLAAVAVIPTGARAQAPPDSTAAPHDSTAVPPPAPAPVQVSTPPPAATPVQAAPAPAAPAQDAGMFSKGKRATTVVAGWGHTFGQDYLLIGVGARYFIRDGLDLGLDFEGWLISDPSIYKLSPRVDYVLYKMKRIKPYAGAFYRYNFIGSDIDDKSSLGGRAGAFYQGKGRGMAGAGVVYERYLNLDERLGSSDVFYPEFFVAVAF